MSLEHCAHDTGNLAALADVAGQFITPEIEVAILSADVFARLGTRNQLLNQQQQRGGMTHNVELRRWKEGHAASWIEKGKAIYYHLNVAGWDLRSISASNFTPGHARKHSLTDRRWDAGRATTVPSTCITDSGGKSGRPAS